MHLRPGRRDRLGAGRADRRGAHPGPAGARRRGAHPGRARQPPGLRGRLRRRPAKALAADPGQPADARAGETVTAHEAYLAAAQERARAGRRRRLRRRRARGDRAADHAGVRGVHRRISARRSSSARRPSPTRSARPAAAWACSPCSGPLLALIVCLLAVRGHPGPAGGVPLMRKRIAVVVLAAAFLSGCSGDSSPAAQRASTGRRRRPPRPARPPRRTRPATRGPACGRAARCPRRARCRPAPAWRRSRNAAA